MCLNCANIGAKGKEAIIKLLSFCPYKNYLVTPDNKYVLLNNKQTDEIIKNAVVVVATGVDFITHIWAIQWPKDYEVQNFS